MPISTTETHTKRKNTPPPPPPPTSPPSTSTGSGRYVIDPVTRIEGHLRIEVEIRNGQVASAWSSGMLFRGVEMILKDRNPEDAWLFTQRLCGVCTYVHGSTSVRCVENALKINVPRQRPHGPQYADGRQVLHDLSSSLPPVRPGLGGNNQRAQGQCLGNKDIGKCLSPNAPAIDFAAAQARLQAFVASGQLGVFAGAYSYHPAYLLSPEENLLLAAHYLEALKLQARSARMHAIFGGKNPHVQSLRVGG